ncbi:hypothetical protein NLU13_7492 [Sarocladium strictum]|uniref:C2H2-type domain-containing protein n=1 Tax=Sarocladium strictum TaxID=5046 RepID=A0AA39GED9_SARSR|nr:hypothetical protein NLU13_7492 [Sarocladium strictum]
MATAYRAERLKEQRGLRAKAPIAAQFEDCVQAFQQLSDSLQVKLSSSSLQEGSKDCYARLMLWAQESGASSRLLDYTLRGCPALKHQSLRLLEELLITLQKVINEVLLQDVAIDSVEAEDAAVEANAVPNVEGTGLASLLDDPLLGLLSGDDEVGVEAAAEGHLAEAEDIVAALFQLMPALQDPFEQDDRDAVPSQDPQRDTPEEPYANIAHALFPNVSKSLAGQFGALNSQRLRGIWPIKQVNKRSRSKRQLNARNASKGLGSLSGSSKRPGFSQQTPWPILQYQSTRGESDEGTSTIRSHIDLSKSPSLDHTSMTSVGGEIPESPIMQYLVPPSVPVDLSSEDQFECPYCQSDLPLTFSSERMVYEDWVAHIYHDLKPYVCTFEGCPHQQRPTGDRQQWFLHELSCHRLQPVWRCSVCREDFETAEKFEGHLKLLHPAVSREEWLFVAENCRSYSTLKAPLLDCKLCSKPLGSLAEVESHVGRHLEAYALSALFHNDLPDEGPVGKAELLNEYLEEQRDEFQQGTRKTRGSSDGDHSDASTINASVATDVGQADSALDGTGTFEVGSYPRTNGSDKVREFLDRQKLQAPFSSVRTGLPDRYDNFVGRNEDLEAMYAHLSSPGRVCTISGRGGIGKTALGVEYVHKYGSEYPHVFWVESDNPGICAEKYGAIATTLNIVEKPLTTEDTRTFLVKDYLTKSETRWLLVFDNVAAWEDISRYIPRTLAATKGSVLITTRTGPMLTITPTHPIYHRQHAVRLDVWPLQHAREFLLTSIQPKMSKESLRNHEEWGLAAQVVEVVGRLPLAVSMIVGYIKVSRCNLSDFMEMWEEKEHITRKKRRRNLDMDSSDIDSTIDSLWTIGIREVRMNSRRLLDVLSFLDPDTIHKHLLVGDHKEEYLEFLNSSETISYKRMINELKGRRLVTVRRLSNGEEVYSIHRLLQQKVLLDMEDLGFVDAFRKAFRLVRRKFPFADPQQVPKPSNWATCSEYMPHVFALHRVHRQNASASVMEMNPVEIAKLFYDAAFYIWSRQTNSYDPLSFLKSASDILDRLDDEKNAKVRADILCIHGLLLLNMGCVERAKGPILLKQALEIRKRIYDADPTIRDNDVLCQNAANDYALCLLNEHKFIEAGEVIRSCRDRYLLWGSEDVNPWENAKYYGNYSVVLMWKGNLDEAINHQLKSLQLMEQYSTPGSLYYRRMFLLGCYLLQKGDYEGALDKHLEVLTARLEMQGKHHEHTISSIYAVGAMYHHLQKPKIATEYMQQCLEFSKSSWWDRAAYTRAQYHLALLYREQGIEEQAADHLEGLANSFLDEFSEYISEAVRGVDDKLMIFDDLQPTFLGRYTGVQLLKHLQEQHKAKTAGE